MSKLIKRLAVILIFINFIYVFSGVLHYPLRSMDVYAIWLLKAKIFYYSSGFPYETFRTIGYSHPQYPILLPYLFSLIYRLVGGVKEFYVLILYPLIYLGVLFVTYRTLISIKINRTLVYLLVYIYSMFSILLAQAGRNHAGTADIVVCLMNWIILNLSLKVKSNDNYRFIIALIIGITGLIKMEGVFYSVLLLFLPIKSKKKVIPILLAVTPSLMWQFFRINSGIPSDLNILSFDPIELINRNVNVIVGCIIEMLNYRNWYIFWPLFWLVDVFQRTKWSFLRKIIYPTILLISLLFFLVYIFSRPQAVSSSVGRLYLQMSPLFLLIFAHKINLLLNKD